tara:strand:+ start:854 stop:1315 length:462 start_codon:yes stop_codon:yes gene_type:complete
MKSFILFFMILLVLGCQDVEKPKKPDNLIAEDQMKEILYDVSLINAIRSFSITKLKTSGIQPDKFIYEKYNIDSTQFAESLSYYAIDFNQFTRIWQDVNDSIEKNRDIVDSLKDEADSLKRASLDTLEKRSDKLNREPFLSEIMDKSINDSID